MSKDKGRKDKHCDEPRRTTALRLLCKGRRTRKGEIKWTMTFPDGTSAKKVELEQDSGAWETTIILRPPEHVPVSFRRNDPIWADEISCPPDAGIFTTQIEVISCSDSELRFLNKNLGKKRRISYQLNFADGTSHDPMFKNGGGR